MKRAEAMPYTHRPRLKQIFFGSGSCIAITLPTAESIPDTDSEMRKENDRD